MSSRRSRVYDSSRTESEGMLARHQEASQRREKREGEAGDYSEMQEVFHSTDRSLAAGVFN